MAPECKSEISMMNGFGSLLKFLIYTVGVRPVETRFGYVTYNKYQNQPRTSITYINSTKKHQSQTLEACDWCFTFLFSLISRNSK